MTSSPGSAGGPSLEELLGSPGSGAGAAGPSPGAHSAASGGGGVTDKSLLGHSAGSGTGSGAGSGHYNINASNSGSYPGAGHSAGAASGSGGGTPAALSPNALQQSASGRQSGGGGGAAPVSGLDDWEGTGGGAGGAGGAGASGGGGHPANVAPLSPVGAGSAGGGGSPAASPRRDDMSPSRAWMHASEHDKSKQQERQPPDELTDELTGPNMRRPMILMLIVAFVGFVLSIAATSVDAYTYNRGNSLLEMTLWTAKACITDAATGVQTCQDNVLPRSSWCAALDSRWRAMQAFSIMVVLYSTLMLVLAYCAVDPARPAIRAAVWETTARCLTPVNFVLAVAGVYWLFLLILWALVAGSFHVAPCKTTVAAADTTRLLGSFTLFESGFKLSSGFSLVLVMWFHWMIALLWILYRKYRAWAYPNEPAPNEMERMPQQQQQQQQVTPPPQNPMR